MQFGRKVTSFAPFLEAMNSAEGIRKLGDVFTALQADIDNIEDPALRARLQRHCLQGVVALAKVRMP